MLRFFRQKKRHCGAWVGEKLQNVIGIISIYISAIVAKMCWASGACSLPKEVLIGAVRWGDFCYLMLEMTSGGGGLI